MPRTIDSGTMRAMTKASYRPVILVEILSPSLPIRLTSNSQDLVYNSNTYTAGGLGGISAIPETDDLNDSQISIIFSGVDPAIKAAVVASDFINSSVSVRAQFFNDNFESSGDGLLYFTGSVASQNIASGASSEITISCKSLIASLSRPRSERYSDQEQRAYADSLGTTDLGMQFASELASRDIIWPTAEWLKENS